MQLLDLTLATPVENVALDEGLLDAAEGDDAGSGEVLRLWESPTPLVVLGRSSRLADEVDEAACAARGIPLLRRSSGGATIVAGPGCLMYAVVLSYRRRPELRPIDRAHRFVLERLATSLRRRVPGVERAGTSDLAVEGRKVSGNSLRCKRDHFLYHGTLLYDFRLELVEKALRLPPRQPDYREGRGHAEFLSNLPLDRAALRAAVVEAFGAEEPLTIWPRERTARLVAERYAVEAWNRER